MKSACYTPYLTRMKIVLSHCCGRLFTVVLLLAGQSFAEESTADPWSGRVAPFMQEVIGSLGTPGTLSLSIENRSSLTPADIATIRKAAEEQVRMRNIRLVNPEVALAEVRITVSENALGILWIAQLKQGLSESVVMKQGQRISVNRAQGVTGLRLNDELLVAGVPGEQFLDAELDANNIHILTTRALLIHPRNPAAAAPRRILVPIDKLPRDARGRVNVIGESVQVFIPGAICSGAIRDQSLGCKSGDDPWTLLHMPMQLRAFHSPLRNFFNGVVSGASQTVLPFYSVAATAEANLPRWLLAGVDGRARLYSQDFKLLRSFAGWGSEVAGITSTCGSRQQVIITKAGDSTDADALQAIEIHGEAVPVTSPLATSGPVMVLRRSQDGSVLAIVHNLKQNNYEVHLLTITCGS